MVSKARVKIDIKNLNTQILQKNREKDREKSKENE